MIDHATPDVEQPATTRIANRDLRGEPPWLFKLRLVKGGPWVRAMISCTFDPDRPQRMVCWINDRLADKIDRVIEYGRQIDRDEYEALPVQDAPMVPIDHLAEPVPEFGQPFKIGIGHNQPLVFRDLHLQEAAQTLLGRFDGPDGIADADLTIAQGAATLLRQITLHAAAMEAGRKEAQAPLRAEIARIADEYDCQAEAYKDDVRAWLACYVERMGSLPHPTLTVFEKNLPVRIEVEDAAKIGRDLMTPDTNAALVRFKATGEVPTGFRLVAGKQLNVR